MKDPMAILRAENAELRARNDKLFSDVMAMNFAVGILTEQFPPFNEHTRLLGQQFLDARAKEWKSKNP